MVMACILLLVVYSIIRKYVGYIVCIAVEKYGVKHRELVV